MTLQYFNNKFVYKRDIDNFKRKEHWKVLKEIDSKYTGDCEDYALTVQKLVPNFNSWSLWYCKTNGNGHCVLRKKDMILCNQCQDFTHIDTYKVKFNATDFRKYWKIAIMYKMTMAKIHRMLDKVLR